MNCLILYFVRCEILMEFILQQVICEKKCVGSKSKASRKQVGSHKQIANKSQAKKVWRRMENNFILKSIMPIQNTYNIINVHHTTHPTNKKKNHLDPVFVFD